CFFFPVADAEVTCDFRESCLLPCQFQDGPQLVIHWIKVSDGNSVVHSYYRDKDQLEHQVQNFKNRTALFKDQISKGNASLLLTGVTIEDEGRYKCYTSTVRGNKESFVNLKTEAPVSKVTIYGDQNKIICSSEGIYPQPELSWSTIPPSNTTLNVTTTVHQTEDQLYSIRSSLVLEDDPDVTYSCTVRTQRNNITSTYRKPETSRHGRALSWMVIGGLIAAAVVVIIVIIIIVTVCVWNKRNQKESRAAKQPGIISQTREKIQCLFNPENKNQDRQRKQEKKQLKEHREEP
uniref:Ig-like domain-containing protein n=1 Tax=Cyprinodon variegatus TaxID=28743 RepID=A0A3Q2DY26_CYPVA